MKGCFRKTVTVTLLLTVVICAMCLMSACVSFKDIHIVKRSSDATNSDTAEKGSEALTPPDYFTVEDSVDPSTNEGIGTLTAYTSSGKELWSVKTDPYQMTELSKTYDIGEQDDRYYIEAGGTVYCINKLDGTLLWKNPAFGGATSAAGFDSKGNLYVCGYYGPMLCVITPEGEITSRLKEPLFRSSAYDPADFYWPTKLQVCDNYVVITFESNNQTLFIVPESGQSEFDTTLLVY